MNEEIRQELQKRNVNIIRFVEISKLSERQTQGFTKAILLGMKLSQKFITDVQENIPIKHDEFIEQEEYTDRLADWLAEFIRQKGYQAYSQSEKSHIENKNFDKKTKTSVLPHKTIALLGGLGFIGKNNLLITEEYGCAFSMCTVLTNAPIETENTSIIASKCGECEACINICPTKAIHGKKWTQGIERELLIDITKCNCPLKCMVHCTWTIKYAKKDVI